MNNVGLSISQWLPCPLAIWAFALDGNLVKILNSSITSSLFGLEHTGKVRTNSQWNSLQTLANTIQVKAVIASTVETIEECQGPLSSHRSGECVLFCCSQRILTLQVAS